MMNWIWLGAVVTFGVLEAATAALVSIWFVGGAAVALLASFLGAALWLRSPVSGGLRGYSGGGPAPDKASQRKNRPYESGPGHRLYCPGNRGYRQRGRHRGRVCRGQDLDRPQQRRHGAAPSGPA